MKMPAKNRIPKYILALLVLLVETPILASQAYLRVNLPHPGPAIPASKGEVWPHPLHLNGTSTFFTITTAMFTFQLPEKRCLPIMKAATRYINIMWRETTLSGGHNSLELLKQNPFNGGAITSLKVSLQGDCERFPHAEMNEAYTLNIDGQASELIASSTWGVLRGLETFVQLLVPVLDGRTLTVRNVFIKDTPRFIHRGLLLDTGRHYLPVSDILLEIDALVAVKMNVLHWHIVDDQSFPYQSSQFPALSDKGAFDNVTAIYTQSDVRKVLAYARNRGIRVIPEFDTPGHVRSWADGQPGLVTECYEAGKPTGQFANIDPTREENKHFLKTFFGEITSLFFDDYIHIGGDEVGAECWKSNPSVLSYMKKHKIANFTDLESSYISWLVKTIGSQGKQVIAWEEVLTSGGPKPPSSVVIHNWLLDPAKLLPEAVKSGYKALLSRGWYLDHLDNQWTSMYLVEPTQSWMKPEEKNMMLGGEACMWGEMVDTTNIHSRVWPRAAAVAERLWSPLSSLNLRRAKPRIEELTCRLRRRGIPASPPNGPSFCFS